MDDESRYAQGIAVRREVLGDGYVDRALGNRDGIQVDTAFALPRTDQTLVRVRRDGYREGERVEVGSAGQEHVDRVVLAIGVTVTDVNPVVVRRAEVHPCREPLRPFGEQRREAGGGTTRVDL